MIIASRASNFAFFALFEFEYALKKSRFTEFFVQHNAIDKFGFREWIFSPGMLFHSQHKWWEKGGIRRRPHEGLDFCFYRDMTGLNHSLNEKTKIPVMYEGKVAGIHDDFLGKSLFVSHDFYDEQRNRLYTIYGHTNPYPDVDLGRVFREGEAIAVIAATRKRDSHILSHLHISVAWLPKSFPYNKLSWETMGNRGVATLCDPLKFIDGNYTIDQKGIA